MERAVGLPDKAVALRSFGVSRNPYTSRRCLPASIRCALSRARSHSGHGGIPLVDRQYWSREAVMGWPQKLKTLRGRMAWRIGTGELRVITK